MINSIEENVPNTPITSQNLQLSIQLTVQDRDGVRPLDVASANGFAEMVRQLLIIVPNSAEICRLPGIHGKSAIHHASINGRVTVIDALLEICPGCVKEVTSFKETALHLAVKHDQSEAVKSLLQWLERLGVMEVVNWKDKDGNTVLHYAAFRKQLEIAKLLLDENTTTRNPIEVDAKNSAGLTAMDLLPCSFKQSSRVSQLKKILQDAGGVNRVAALPCLTEPSSSSLVNITIPTNWGEIINLFKFNYERDLGSELRNALLVVAALFVTLAFEALINLPGHIFPDDQRSGGKSYQVMYLVATFGLLVGSLFIMNILTADMPFPVEMVYAELFLLLSAICSILRTQLSIKEKSLIIIVPYLVIRMRWQATRLLATLQRWWLKYYSFVIPTNHKIPMQS